VEEIVKTLPIGLYAKRRIPMSCDIKAETSYYIPSEDRIVISFPIIATALKALPDNATPDKIETAIRSMVYHETGHGMLTPKTLMNYAIDDIQKYALNVFEDERLETILAQVFLDVDFIAQKYAINGISPSNIPKPTTTQEAFYYAVRFRYGKKEWLKDIDNIIKKYWNINVHTNYYFFWDYYHDVIQLYEKIQREFPREKDYDKIEMPSLQNINGSGHGIGQEEGKKAFHNAVNLIHDMSLYNALSIIIEGFNKKNSKGNATTGYSGILNPRLADRPDYRIFDRASSTRGNNSFGTFHLNLFLDISGSMACNQDKINALLWALAELERKNKNFTFDLITCECGQKHITDKSQYCVQCVGGNSLTNEIFQQYKKVQYTNTYNYNVVLFDGDACPQNSKNFQAFDYNNCTIITDPQNEKYLKNNTKCRIIITKDYTEELFDNILKVMHYAFR
jgi:hypothetical protein